MKSILFGITILALTCTACTQNSSKPTEANNADSANVNTTTPSENPSKQSTNEVVTHYLHLKNALTADNSQEAATAGKAIVEALQKIDTATLTADQSRAFGDMKDDMTEHGKHIGDNANKIEHQREHFEMLSNGLYDLLKSLGTERTLYKDNCPMYNDKKGANWISEVKEIKNPYYGKKMLTCGTMKEEIK